MNQNHVFVIGSGPAGVAAAFSLVKQGVEVTMIDVGEESEPQRRDTVDELYAAEFERWNPKAVEKLRAGMSADTAGIPQKLVYGSDYPYRDLGQIGRLETSGVECLMSGAKGGLSNAWGANLMPYHGRDIDDWCVDAGDLSRAYAQVASFIPVSAGPDDLEEWFPLHGATKGMLQPSSQAVSLVETLRKNREALRANGIIAGYSRLAVQTNPTDANPRGCVYCGLCMYGCPYRLIYSSASTVEELKASPNFKYITGVVVEKLRESDTGVEVLGKRVGSGEPVAFAGKRVYVACGAIATTKLLLESLGAYGSKVLLRDRHYFLLPMMHYAASTGVIEERLHTLGQAYLEVFDAALSRRTIQLQFYTYNDLYLQAMRKKFGPFAAFSDPIMPHLLGRLSIVMGYLHSDDSSALAISLEAGAKGNTLRIEPVPSERPRQLMDAIVRKLWKLRGLVRAVPVKFMMQSAKPGKSYHYGGTFPMKTDPGRFECDSLGRPSGFRRVHAVDATVLPSIASTTVVFTAMANAFRIASRHGALE